MYIFTSYWFQQLFLFEESKSSLMAVNTVPLVLCMSVYTELCIYTHRLCTWNTKSEEGNTEKQAKLIHTVKILQNMEVSLQKITAFYYFA